MKAIGWVTVSIVGVAILIGIAFGLELIGLEWTRYFAPKREDVRRETFEHTRSFNEAKKQELLKYRLEWVRAEDDVEREAIESTIRHAFADYDENQLDEELRGFLQTVRYGERRLR